MWYGIQVIWRRSACTLSQCSILLSEAAVRGRRRKAESGGGTARNLGACSTTIVVAGALVTLENKMRTLTEITSHNQSGAADWKILAEDLARTLMVNGMAQIGDVERFKVVTA
jgi:hypothetical protein